MKLSRADGGSGERDLGWHPQSSNGRIPVQSSSAVQDGVDEARLQRCRVSPDTRARCLCKDNVRQSCPRLGGMGGTADAFTRPAKNACCAGGVQRPAVPTHQHPTRSKQLTFASSSPIQLRRRWMGEMWNGTVDVGSESSGMVQHAVYNDGTVRWWWWRRRGETAVPLTRSKFKSKGCTPGEAGSGWNCPKTVPPVR